MNNAGPVLETRGLSRAFTQGGETIHVLRGVDLAIGAGEIVALLGPSGSGKSTLLQAVGLLEGGFGGSIRIAGAEAAQLSAADRTATRRDRLGFVYQFHHLLPDFTALENVELPQLIHGAEQPDATARASGGRGGARSSSSAAGPDAWRTARRPSSKPSARSWNGAV